MKLFDEEKSRAFNNILCSIDSAVSFPEQVFIGRWESFMFFESDRLFASSFATTAVDLMRIEKSEIICLINFDEISEDGETGAALFLDTGINPQTYDDLLRRGGSANGWLFNADRYGVASNIGGWSIYCEKSNDVAVIAFHQSDDTKKYAECLGRLHAEPIAVMLRAGPAAIFPFSKLIEPWRHGLNKNYC